MSNGEFDDDQPWRFNLTTYPNDHLPLRQIHIGIQVGRYYNNETMNTSIFILLFLVHILIKRSCFLVFLV